MEAIDIYKGFKFRLYPNNTQSKKINKRRPQKEMNEFEKVDLLDVLPKSEKHVRA